MTSGGVPYIGSKISLISKAEIRYEGILYDVNVNESTVTLSKVRSYGTETRPAPKQVPPRNEVYEYIIFRGSDIKDLSVSEIPKPEDLPQDPAILSTQSIPPPTSRNLPQAPSSVEGPSIPTHGSPYTPFPPSLGSYNPFTVPYFNRPPLLINQPLHHLQQPGTIQRITSSSSSQPPSVSEVTSPPKSSSSHPPVSSPPSNASPPSITTSPATAPVIETSTPNDTVMSSNSNQSAIVGAATNTVSPPTSAIKPSDVQQDDNNVRMGNEQREKKKTSFGVHHYYHQNREGSANKDRYRSRGSDTPYRSRGGGATARGGRGQASTRQPLQYDSEFDFDSANALFAKETLEEEMEQKMKLEENEEQPIGVKPTTEDDEEKLEGYDKSTSFFDNISCEANNVTKRSTRNHDNALNTETFGVTSRGYNRGGWSKGGRGPRRGYYHRGGNRSYNNYYSQGNEGSSYRGHYKGRGRGRGYNRDNQSYTRNDYRS